MLKQLRSKHVLCILGSGVILALAALYAGLHANLVYANVQDATIYPYLFKGLHPHDVILPGSHPNILKFPLFWLQSVLPYDFLTFSIVNVGLLLATVFGWCLLLAYVFGKRRLALIFLIMTAVVLGASTLVWNLLETTIRNIEYPIGLAFMLMVSRLLEGRAIARKHAYLFGA